MSEVVKRQAMSAAIYCRISRDPSGAELGVRRQEKDCRAVAEREGWDVIEILVDDDRSAYSGKPRPAYQRLCELLKEEAVDVLVAWHPDRLTRQPRELEDLIDLLESTNTRVRTVQTGEYDLGTPRVGWRPGSSVLWPATSPNISPLASDASMRSSPNRVV